MKSETLKEDVVRMEQIMDKTVDRCDIWQDRFIYWIAVAIYHILIKIDRMD